MLRKVGSFFSRSKPGNATKAPGRGPTQTQQQYLTFDQWIEAEIQKVLRHPAMVAKDPNDGPAVAAARRHELGRIRRLESMRDDPTRDEDDF